MPFCFRVCYRSVSVLFPNCNLLYFTFPRLSNTLTEFCGLRTKLILHFREICMHSFIKNCNSLSNAFFSHSACFSEQKQRCADYPQAVHDPASGRFQHFSNDQNDGSRTFRCGSLSLLSVKMRKAVRKGRPFRTLSFLFSLYSSYFFRRLMYSRIISVEYSTPRRPALMQRS